MSAGQIHFAFLLHARCTAHRANDHATHEPYVVLLLGRRHRRRPKIKTTLGQHPVFAGHVA